MMASMTVERTRTPGIFRRGSKYVVPYREPDTGKQRKPSFATYEAARQFKRGREVDVDRGEYQQVTRETLHDYARGWLDRYQGGRRGFREETRRDYRSHLDLYVFRYFPETLRLVDVSPRRVSLFVGWLCDPTQHDGRELADKTVRNVVGTLRSCLSTARAEGLIRHNPATGVQLPNRPRVEEDDDEDTRALAREQLRMVLDLIHPRHRLLFRLLAGTGLRISEAIGLEWRHVVLDGSSPHVKVRQRIRGGKVGAPKSRHSRRDVPLTASLVDGLRQQQATTEWPGEDAPVFPSMRGTPLHKDNLRNRALKPAVQEAGVAWAGLHTFRHTFASLHIERGTNVVQLAKLLGHHSPTVTLSTYAHLLDDGVGEPLDLDAELASGNRVAISAAFGVSDTTDAVPSEVAA